MTLLLPLKVVTDGVASDALADTGVAGGAMDARTGVGAGMDTVPLLLQRLSLLSGFPCQSGELAGTEPRRMAGMPPGVVRREAEVRSLVLIDFP